MAARFELPKQEISVVNTFVHFREDPDEDQEVQGDANCADERPSLLRRLKRRAVTAPATNDDRAAVSGSSDQEDGDSGGGCDAKAEEDCSSTSDTGAEGSISEPEEVQASFMHPGLQQQSFVPCFDETETADTSGHLPTENKCQRPNFGQRVLSSKSSSSTSSMSTAPLHIAGQYQAAQMNPVVGTLLPSTPQRRSQRPRISIEVVQSSPETELADSNRTMQLPLHGFAQQQVAAQAKARELQLQATLTAAMPTVMPMLLMAPMRMQTTWAQDSSFEAAYPPVLLGSSSCSQSRQNMTKKEIKPRQNRQAKRSREIPVSQRQLQQQPQQLQLLQRQSQQQPQEPQQLHPQNLNVVLPPLQPGAIFHEVLAVGNKECIRWSVDARKLDSHGTKILSPEFSIRPSPQDRYPFRLMILATETHGRGGASFRKAGGRARIAVKCESPMPRGASNISISMAVGSGYSARLNCGPVEHNFADWCCCYMQKEDEDWDLKVAIDRETRRLEVLLEVSY
eukprot:TRINITY_DN1461_c0_g1_i1.p1 TRINITY_DN1461_c0_g1~~TRINITY_DN1461_c0_g1_i1.p1  ORF type:complete len:510 (-),score=99.66 TRINITY_DN1461_c0_g1_i1:257-1786(-)